MKPEQATGARLGGDGVAMAEVDPSTNAIEPLHKAVNPAIATAVEPDPPTYKSFRELPRVKPVRPPASNPTIITKPLIDNIIMAE